MTDPTPNTENTQPASRGIDFDKLKRHCLTNKVDVSLWAIRLLTIIFTLGYFIPIFGSAQNAYYKALLANAATSALRLHQRCAVRPALNLEYVATIFLEDSAHYIIYTLIFMFVPPVTLVLLPVVLFAILHCASYSLTLLDLIGQNSWWGARLIISLVEFQSRNILRLVAFTEIVLMPMCIILAFMGRAGILVPFIYYQFLMKRYTSRRNQYNKNMFHEMRLLTEQFAHKPSMPGFFRSFLLKAIDFFIKIAPPLPPVHQQ